MINIEEIRNFCLSFENATESSPFGPDNIVFKVNNKMFALLNIENKHINLKCEPEKALELREQYDYVIAGYHMNKMHWNTIMPNNNIPEKQLKQWITDSYNLVHKSKKTKSA